MIEASPKRNLIFKFLAWHFFEIPKKILIGFGNFLAFNLNYFSIGLLIKTLFSHWRRYKESYGRGFDPKKYFFVFMGNMISRVLGAIVRIIVIAIGLAFEALILVSGIVSFIVWIVLPLALVILFWSGAQLLFNL